MYTLYERHNLQIARKLLLESGNYAKQKKKKKEGMTTNSFFKSPKYSTGAPIKIKRDNLSFFFAQSGRSRSPDLIHIFFYMEWHNFSDSLFCSSFDAIGLNPQDIDHPSTFQES